MKCAVSRYEAFPGSVLPKLLLVCASLGLVGGCSAASAEADAEAAGDDAKRIVLISGPSGYPAGVHEYNAGVAFLRACLDEASCPHVEAGPGLGLAPRPRITVDAELTQAGAQTLTDEVLKSRIYPSHDAAEGALAFKEKRAPVFKRR
jgi:hypothetical protein